jgi:hypothetical protein
MKRILPILLATLTVFVSANVAAEDLPTLMTKRGKQIVDQPLDQSPPLFDGKSNGFASGFKGWRWNAVPRGGKWAIENGAFRGRETPEVKHPATASYGFDFKNVIIQCEVRMNDVPMEGRAARYLNIRTTDTKDYICSIILNEAGFRIQKDDNDHGGPDKAVPLGAAKLPMKLNEWQTVVFEIMGDEMVGTVNGKSLTGNHPLIASEKRSVMFVCGVEGSFRNLKAWEAEPNPEWAKNKAKILAEMKAAAPTK